MAENIVLGEETMRGRVFLDLDESRRRISELGSTLRVRDRPGCQGRAASGGWQQRVEILKALYRDARILVLDEPTAVLTPQETKEIFAVLRRLAAEGHSIVFISHKLYEVLEIADRITVIRRGKVVGQRLPAETDEDDLAELMVGREVQLAVDRGESHPGEVGLGVARPARRRTTVASEAVRGVDLEVRAGEILGIAGVAGNGQDQLVEAIMGLRGPRPARCGSMARTSPASPRAPSPTPASGTCLVTASDSASSCASRSRTTSCSTAITARLTRAEGCATTRRSRATRRAHRRVRHPRAVGGGRRRHAFRWQPAEIIVAREYSRALRLLVLDQPTRGLDVGSIEFIHRQTIEKRERGTAILLVSAELDEVLELSDRMAVMYRGRIVAERDGRTADKNEVGLLMATGGRETRDATAPTAEHAGAWPTATRRALLTPLGSASCR